MGLYSTNRISSISAPESSVTDFLGEEVNDRNFLDESYIETVKENSEFTNVVETSIMIREAEFELFNDLLEADFITSMNQQMLIEATSSSMKNVNDDKKKDIITKFNNFLNTVAEGANQAGTRTSSKITSMIQSDSSAISKYKNIINGNNIQGFKGIRRFVLPGKEYENFMLKETDMNKYVTIVITAAKNIKKANSKDDIDKLVQKAADDISAVFNACNEQNVKNCSTKSHDKNRWVPTDNECKTVVSFMDGNRVKANLSKGTKSIYGAITKVSSSLVSIMSSINCNDGEISVYKINKIRQIGSTLGYVTNAIVDDLCNYSTREFAAYRKAFLVLGHYCSKRARKQGVSEAVLFSIGESSDVYVYEYFDY